jgi:hypothetical protein
VIMSDLQYQTLEELYSSELECGRYIIHSEKAAAKFERAAKHNESIANGQRERLRWIRKYIRAKLDAQEYKDKGAGI